MGAEQLNTNPLLDKKLINAFIDGVQRTIEMMASTEVKTGKPYVEKVLTQKGEIAGLIGMVAGKMKGNMTITFQRKAIFSILESMLGETYTEMNEEVQDAVGELTNQIYGSAKTTLNELGYGFEMAIPTVLSGDYEIRNIHQGASLVIPFMLPDDSKFHIEITVEG